MCSLPPFTPFESRVFVDASVPAFSGDQRHQALEVHLRVSTRLVGRTLTEILHESSPVPLNNNSMLLLSLPLHDLNHDPHLLPIQIEQLISSLSITLVAREIVAAQIASSVSEIMAAAGNNDTEAIDFHIVAVVDYVQIVCMKPVHIGMPADASTLENVPEEIGDEDLGDCCICLEEFECEKREVIKIPCGHVYHDSCIYTWLLTNNNCPLCRIPILPLEDSA